MGDDGVHVLLLLLSLLPPPLSTGLMAPVLVGASGAPHIKSDDIMSGRSSPMGIYGARRFRSSSGLSILKDINADMSSESLGDIEGLHNNGLLQSPGL